MLMQIPQEYQLEVKRTTRKHEIKRLNVEQLVEGNVLPDSCLEVINLYQWNLPGNCDQATRN